MRAGVLPFAASPLHLSGRWCQEFWYPDEVVGDHLEGEETFGLGEAPEFELCGAAYGFGPAEALLDALAAALADLIALVPGGTAIDGGLADAAGG